MAAMVLSCAVAICIGRGGGLQCGEKWGHFESGITLDRTRSFCTSEWSKEDHHDIEAKVGRQVVLRDGWDGWGNGEVNCEHISNIWLGN